MKNLLLFGAMFIATTSFGQGLTENFDAVTAPGLPTGWTTSNASGGDAFETGTSANANAGGFWPVPAHGQFAMANDDVCNCTMTTVYLTSPSMDFSTATGMGLKYSCVDDGTYGGNPHSVEVSTDGGSTWNTIYTHTFNPNIVWEDVTVALANTDNQSDVRFRFKYDDGGSWATGVAIDDVVVEALPAVEVAVSGVNLVRYAALNANSVLSVDVTNLGANTITSLEIDWNDGMSHIQTINTNIAPGATTSVAHPDAVTYAAAVERTINVSINAANGGPDDDASNNNGQTLHNTLSQATNKAVVIEEGTGTWCGWCPRGAVAMDYMVSTYPNDFIGIAVHNGDPMTVTAYDNGADISGFPGCNVDRVLLDASVSQSAFQQYYNDRVNLGVPANIGATVSGTGSSVTIDASATFYTPVSSANFRLGVVIVENGVTGTTSGYAQANYYSGGTTAMGGYESLPDPVPAAQMVYDHVGRALLGGYSGQAGSVPATITDGTVANYSFNYTVPSTSTRANMKAVVMLLDLTTGEIVNATEVSIAEAGIDNIDEISLEVYPNPASDIVNVSFEAEGDYTITITDLAGREVATQSLSNLTGSQKIAVPTNDLNSGNYIISVATAGASYSQVLVIK